jgi:hypothetical protein
MGTAPPEYQGWVTHTVHCHGFDSLLMMRGDFGHQWCLWAGFSTAKLFVYSPEFEGLGHQWSSLIYPEGKEGAEEGMVSLFLNNASKEAIKMDFGFSFNDGNGKQVAFKRSSYPHDLKKGCDGSSRNGITNFAKHSDLLSSLVDGTLTIEVRTKLAKKLSQDKEDDCCVVCMSTKNTHVFILCSHMCVCEGCAALIERSGGEDCKQCPFAAQ